MARNRRLAVGAVVAGIALVVGVTPLVANATSALRSDRVKVQLPERPSRAELHPTIYDQNGCLKQAPEDGGGVKCGPGPEVEKGRRAPHSTGDHASLRGFEGTQFAAEVEGTSVAILNETLHISNAGRWTALGLVRNETPKPIGNTIVTATLVDGAGAILERVSSNVLVSNLRAGEPGPFKLEASVDVARVARVEWTVVGDHPSRLGSRDFDIRVNGEVPFGSPTYKGGARKDTTYPYVLYASIRNLGGTVKNPKLVVAWLDGNGRVQWLQSSPLHPDAEPTVEVDGVAAFAPMKVEDPGIAQGLNGSKKLMWVVGE